MRNRIIRSAVAAAFATLAVAGMSGTSQAATKLETAPAAVTAGTVPADPYWYLYDIYAELGKCTGDGWGQINLGNAEAFNCYDAGGYWELWLLTGD